MPDREILCHKERFRSFSFKTRTDRFPFSFLGAITNETSLFTYDTRGLLHDFVHGPKHNSSFVPVFSPPQDADPSLLQQAAALCQADPFCRFDVLTTGDLAVGNITRLSHQRFRQLQQSLRPGNTHTHTPRNPQQHGGSPSAACGRRAFYARHGTATREEHNLDPHSDSVQVALPIQPSAPSLQPLSASGSHPGCVVTPTRVL